LKSAARNKTPARKIARSLKRSEGATRQKAFSLGLSLDSRGWRHRCPAWGGWPSSISWKWFPRRSLQKHGVTRYQHDHTQGPACAIACGAATIYRNYFVFCVLTRQSLICRGLWNLTASLLAGLGGGAQSGNPKLSGHYLTVRR